MFDTRRAGLAAAEFAREHHECPIEEPPFVEIPDELGGRLVPLLVVLLQQLADDTLPRGGIGAGCCFGCGIPVVICVTSCASSAIAASKEAGAEAGAAFSALFVLLTMT